MAMQQSAQGPQNGSQESMNRLYEPERHNDDDYRLKHPRLRKVRKYIGLDHRRPLKVHEGGAEHLLWPRIRTTFQEPFAEFLGTMILALIYNGSLAQAILSAGETTAPGGYGYGSYMSVPWGVGIGVMLGIYIAGDSGSYLNPAITLANCIYRGLPWASFPIIVAAQFLGAFVGSGLVFANYVDAINYYSGYRVRAISPTPKATASIFATYPQTFTTKPTQAFSIIIPSMIVSMVVSALKDDYNNGISKAGGNFFPLAMFFLFYAISIAFGWETGGATNPALDFSGRLMSNAVGYPSEVWWSSGYYFWMPLILPSVGTILGNLLYDSLVYTGPSPINTSYLGLEAFFRPQTMRRAKERQEKNAQNPNTDAV